MNLSSKKTMKKLLILTILLISSCSTKDELSITDENKLFSVIDNKDMALSKAVDTIRTKYGLYSLQTADVAQSLGRI